MSFFQKSPPVRVPEWRKGNEGEKKKDYGGEV